MLPCVVWGWGMLDCSGGCAVTLFTRTSAMKEIRCWSCRRFVSWSRFAKAVRESTAETPRRSGGLGSPKGSEKCVSHSAACSAQGFELLFLMEDKLLQFDCLSHQTEEPRISCAPRGRRRPEYQALRGH